jgi:hypothetical protein
LSSTHAAIATAIQSNRSQEVIDAAVNEYAQQAAAMTALEMQALAQVLQTLDQEQRANGAGVRSAFFRAASSSTTSAGTTRLTVEATRCLCPSSLFPFPFSLFPF